MLFIFLIFGLIVGSFLNAVIYRLYDGKSISRGRSQCPYCNHDLSAVDLIPLVSFILLAGKCRYCRKPISWQYPIIEIVTGLVFVLIGIKYNFLLSEELIFTLVMSSYFIVIAVFDLKHYLILDRVVFSGIIIALIHIIYQIFAQNQSLFSIHSGLVQGIFGAAIISGFFALQYYISSGRWIGFGDVKLGLFLGLMFGIGQTLMLLLISYCSGAIVGLLLIAAGKRDLGGKMPFGTFLAFCGIIMMLYGPALISWYLALLGV